MNFCFTRAIIVHALAVAYNKTAYESVILQPPPQFLPRPLGRGSGMYMEPGATSGFKPQPYPFSLGDFPGNLFDFLALSPKGENNPHFLELM